MRLGRHRLGIEGFDGFDNRGFVGRRENESVADTDLAGGDATGDDATSIELVHVLDRKAERLAYGLQFFSEEPQRLQDRRTLIPPHVVAAVGNVVTQLGAGWDKALRHDLELFE